MIRTHDDLIPQTRIAMAIRPKCPPHLSTVIRWTTVGVGNPPVKLATIKIGGRRFTTAAAIAAFVAATTCRPSEVLSDQPCHRPDDSETD